MKNFVAFYLLLVATFGSYSAQAQCPPPMVGEPRILVTYSPGPNWSRPGEFLQGHLAFLLAQMNAGTIASAGPHINDSGELTGGLSKYALASRSEAEQLAHQDPFVSNGVVTIDSKFWMECHLPR